MTERLIPKRYRTGLGLLMVMSDPASEELLQALMAEHPILANTSFLAYLRNNVKEIPASGLEAIVPALFWLCSGRSITKQSTEQLARDVSQSQDLEATGEVRQKLEQRLTSVLASKLLTVAWKALDVATEQENTFYNARILTDIRPIFGDDTADMPEAAVVVHTLKIAFHKGRQHEEIFFALDMANIRQLKEALDRAEKKEVALKALLQTTVVTYLDVAEEQL